MSGAKGRIFDGVRVAGLGLVAVPSLSAALNLGELELQSRLGEPLNLLIPVVTNTGDEPGTRITVELAPRDAYAAAGLEEVVNLRNATLSLETGTGGQQRIRLRSTERVLEPIVPILLEVRQGRVTIRRSYSVLLDLPGHAPALKRPQKPAAPVAAAASAVPSAPAPVARPAAQAPAASAPFASREPAREPRPALSGERTMVLPGETLGELSQRVRRNPATPLHRMMRKVYAANPQAFDGHPDRMWAGADINVPLEEPLPAGAIVGARGIATFALPAPLPGQPFPLFPAGKLSLTLSRLPTVEEIARLAGASAPIGKSVAAKRWSNSLSPSLAQAASPAPAAAATPAQASTAIPAADEAPAALASSVTPEVTQFESEPAEMAAATAVSEVAVAPTPMPAEPGSTTARGSWTTRVLPLLLLAIAGFIIWLRRATGSTRVYRPMAMTMPVTKPVPKLPVAGKNTQRPELQPVAPKVALPEPKATTVAAPPLPTPEPEPVLLPEIPEAAAPELTPPVMAEAMAPLPEIDFDLEVAPENSPPPPKSEPEPAPMVTAPVAAAEPPAAAPTQASGSAKVVSMTSLRRREDPSIEVSERALPEATGGLTGFYADVAKMLIGALESNPARSDLRLKLLEVYFAAGMADEFLRQTRIYLESLRGRHDNSWTEVAEMGRQLYPSHEWFRVGTPPLLGGKPSDDGKQTQNFNRYYEGVDQVKLRSALDDLEQHYKQHSRDPAFLTLRQSLLSQHAGRPSPLVQAATLSRKLGGAQLFLKREPRHGYGHDHLINAIGQVALAKRMGRNQVLTATSNGLHGLAVAIVARSQKLGCRVFIDEQSARANHARVLRIKELGAELEIVRDTSNLPEVDARRSALSSWIENSRQSLFISSLSSGPHPYPKIMQEALGLVGREARNQMQAHTQRPPAAIVVGIADGPVAIGLMHAFLDEGQTRLHCAENAAVNSPVADRLVGATTSALREHDWPREHAWLRDTQRVQYGSVTEAESLQAMTLMYEEERLMLSEEGARVMAYASRIAKDLPSDQSVVVLLPSQNDADAHFVEQNLGATIRTSAA